MKVVSWLVDHYPIEYNRYANIEVKILRDIILQGPQAVNLDSSLLDTANALPLWPRISSKPGYLTTKEALVAQNSAFVVSWIEDFHRFAKFSDPHHHLSIDDVQMLQQYVLPDLPKFIDEKNRAPYARLIEAITFSSSLNPEISESNKAGKFVLPLNRYPLAARQDRKLCLAADLFDHDEIVFAAAFRAEAPGRFLMLEVRKYSALWNKLGIRRRESGKFNGPDYLDCLRALEGRLNRLEDQQLTADVERVLYPLCTNDRALSDLNNTTWSTIARLPVFLVNPVSGSELEHRRRRMEILASQSYTICLKDIIRQESAAICWSQTPFALHEPSSFSIQKGGSTGQPTCVMVWQHLAFLAESVQSIEEAEVRGFVGDLERTYRHLHLNPGESKCEFTQPSAALWLNVETTSLDSISLDVLKSSWTSLEYLLLDSPCDARPLMMVRPFLGRFSTLLKYLGCKSLYYPQINSLSPSRSETTFTSVQKLWKEGFLTDVKCEAEGNSIHAHKIVLASQSSYFKAQFGGPWAPVSENKVTSNVIKVEDMTYATLRIVIDFCYDEHHDWAAGIQVGPEDELSAIEDKLDGLLDVLVAADRWLMPNLQAEAELHVMTGIKFFIWPNNVETVKRIAEEANATELTKYCKEYIAGNTEAILLASMSG
jgi:sacsin